MWPARLAPSSPPATSQSRASLLNPSGSRRPSHISDSHGASTRPPFSPRSSSLNVSARANASKPNLDTWRVTLGSGLKQEILPTPNVKDPLLVLQKAIGSSIDPDAAWDEDDVDIHPEALEGHITFGNYSLEGFYIYLAKCEHVQQDNESERAQIAKEFEQRVSKLQELHHSISSCDSVLESVETSLSHFQKDLGNVSTEIETLQSRSTGLNRHLDNRQSVEKLLGPAVEEVSVPPSVVKRLCEGRIDRDWVTALAILEKRWHTIDQKDKGFGEVLAVSDLKPMLDDLTKVAIARIRDFFASQIKALRSPNINAQVIQERSFLSNKGLYAFLYKHHSQLADEIALAYGHTMRWYYLTNFTRYMQTLQSIPLYSVDKSDALGTEQLLPRGPPAGFSSSQKSSNALSIGRRLNILTESDHAALPSYIAAEMKAAAYIESPFHAFTSAISDNASAEYTFLTSFFPPSTSFSALSRTFANIFNPTFELSYTFTKQLTGDSIDCLGLLLCVRITQQHAFTLQRRRCSVAEGWINGTNMLLWPKFQVAMDSHIASVRRATSILAGARTTLSLTSAKIEDGKANTAPHPLTQRFGQLLQGLLALSNDDAVANSTLAPMSAREIGATSSDTEPIGRSLQRLRNEIDSFLGRACKGFSQTKRSRFLANNYSLVLTIIGDTGGTLAREQKEWFEGKRSLVGGD